MLFRPSFTLPWAIVALLSCSFLGPETACGARLEILPARVELTGMDRAHGVLVTRVDDDGRHADVTSHATFTSSDPAVATVDGKGLCQIQGDGTAQITVTYNAEVAEVPIVATGSAKAVAPSFRQDIEPILTRTGCNAGGCHGKLAGQNGFRLSLRGYAPEWDYPWMATEVNGRRVNLALPEESLLVQKPVGDVVHEGGLRFKKGSRYYQTFVNWIAARAPGPSAAEADADHLEILPGNRTVQPGEKQQLLVRAHYADGRVRDVTWLTQFFSNDETIVSVKPDGLAKAIRAGETSIRVHFQGQVEVVRFTIPFATVVKAEEFAVRQNAIDEPVFKKLAALRIPPSPLCDDATFLRRAMLDAIGTIPSPEEVKNFVADARSDKRARLVDQLLQRPEYSDYWTLELADLLQNRKERDHDVRGTKGVRAFHAWLHQQVAANRPWNELAKTILLASGNVNENPEVGYYITALGEKTNVGESDLPDAVAQSFLGTRIGCARCHNHPLEKYTQDDFYHFAAYFARTVLKRDKPESGGTVLLTMTREEQEQVKKVEEARARLEEADGMARSFGDEPGGEEAKKALLELEKKLVEANKHLEELAMRPPGINQPRTNKMMVPQPLDRAPWELDQKHEPREQLVGWMFDQGKAAFAGAMVNRLWKHFLGTGLVEPVDDLRASNPPSNPELWALLKDEFVQHGYDLKHVMRLILNSRTYQLSAETRPENATETRFYSHYYARRLPAEVLTDAISTATQAPVAFSGYPVGIKAVQLPEPAVSSYFLTIFGRSDRVTACACERGGEVTLPQLLHLHNSEEVQRQIQDGSGRLDALLKSGSDSDTIDNLFLATLSREPKASERAAAEKALGSGERKEVFADLFWALLNAKEFTFNH